MPARQLDQLHDRHGEMAAGDGVLGPAPLEEVGEAALMDARRSTARSMADIPFDHMCIFMRP